MILSQAYRALFRELFHMSSVGHTIQFTRKPAGNQAFRVHITGNGLTMRGYEGKVLRNRSRSTPRGVTTTIILDVSPDFIISTFSIFIHGLIYPVFPS